MILLVLRRDHKHKGNKGNVYVHDFFRAKDERLKLKFHYVSVETSIYDFLKIILVSHHLIY
jgi:hypothetical protein